MKRVYAQAIICERILNEADGMPSAIRIADVFSFTRSQIPLGAGIPVNLLVTIRLLENDGADHTAKIVLLRPDGEETDVGVPFVGKIVQNDPVAPGGLNFIFIVGVVPRQLGLHTFNVLFDGETVAQSIFTLRELPEVATADSIPSELAANR